MSSRQLFYAIVLVFLIGSVALILGATAGSTAATLFGFVSWIVAAALLVFWFRSKRAVIQ